MLVLDRKVQEGFWIDNRIFVKVLSSSSHRGKIGVEAPRDVSVVREELRPRPVGIRLNGCGLPLAPGKSR